MHNENFKTFIRYVTMDNVMYVIFSMKKNQRTCSNILVDYYCINVTHNCCLSIILITKKVFKDVFMRYMTFDHPCKPSSMRLLICSMVFIITHNHHKCTFLDPKTCNNANAGSF